MNVLWCVQQRNDVETDLLVYAIKEANCEVIYKEFDLIDIVYEFPTNQPVVAIGTIAFVGSMLRRGNGKGEHFYPCAWCDWEILKCHYYYSRWGEFLLQKHYAFYPLGEIIRLKDYIYSHFGNEVFIRPNTNNKSFTGEVVNFNSFDTWIKVLLYHGEQLDTLCVVASTQEIKAEYRMIVADGEVLTGSQYMENDLISYSNYYPKEIEDFVKKVVEKWQPHPIFCLDVAETNDGFKVVECGSMNCAGLYKCDYRKLVQKINEIAIKDFKEIYS